MSLGTLYIICRWLHFAAVMLFTGSAFYSALLSPKRFKPWLSARLHRLLLVTCWLALLSALLLLTAQTGLMSGDWHNISDAETWQAVLDTGFGSAWRWQIALPLVACCAFLLRGETRQRLLLLLGLAQLAGLAFVGHAAMLDGWPGALQRVSQSLHLIGASFWVGGLLPLLMLMAEAKQSLHRSDAIRAMMRFSRYGHLAVAVVILSGLLNSVLILGWPLTGFALYSKLLLAKIVLVGLMATIALVNRYWWVPRFSQVGSGAQQKFVYMTWLELAIAVLVLLLVSIFATMAPG
ncbi:copper homeostasis membrane protein CopD [Paramixta manurensis]|uniref:Copper resistance protein D n=1 Tax=Paramixta manurensis TaxID=2740817 RepID=A0A6M8UCK7_9GAMM|nr:copper homeostasis membrane protein CopD [Erwiniaceae bacterium PD-1]